MNFVVCFFATTGMLFLSLQAIGQDSCSQAKVYIGDVPFICAQRDEFAQGVKSAHLNFKKTLGYKQIYETKRMFALPATAVSLFNRDSELVMLQFIFPANNPANGYKDIRKQMDQTYGAHTRVVGYELSPKFEYRWVLKDGVKITFKRRRGSIRARLTYSLPLKAKAFLYQQGFQQAGK